MAQFGFICLKKSACSSNQTIKMKNRSYDVNGKSNPGYVDHENNTSTEGVFSTKQGISMLIIKIVCLETPESYKRLNRTRCQYFDFRHETATVGQRKPNIYQ